MQLKKLLMHPMRCSSYMQTCIPCNHAFLELHYTVVGWRRKRLSRLLVLALADCRPPCHIGPVKMF
eukprot:scaffold13732_cov36-Prasinocladus_malaysianus.AAC.1